MPEHRLRTDELTIGGVPTRAVRAAGAPGRVRFLFLHGFSDSADCWQRVQRRLAAAGHGSLAVDQPSHGQADPLHPELPVVEQFLAFAAAAARATDDGRPVVVVGNSLGAAHALLLAQHHPELVHGVAAISPASFDHPGWFRVLDAGRLPCRCSRCGAPATARPSSAAAASRTRSPTSSSLRSRAWVTSPRSRCRAAPPSTSSGSRSGSPSPNPLEATA